MNYDIDIKNRIIKKKIGNDIKKWNDGFKKNLHLHYFYDYMTDFWNKNRQVTDLSNLINNESERNKYAFEISDNEWNVFFKDFIKDQLSDASRSFQPKTKLFLDYLIKFKIKNNPNLRRKYFVNNDRIHNKKFYIDIEKFLYY